MKMYRFILIAVIMVLFAGCTKSNVGVEGKKTEITIAAAASLTDAMEQIAADFESENKGVQVNCTFASSVALQNQIEEGAPVDIFISAAKKQMDELKKLNLIDEATEVDLLQNKIVLISNKDNDIDMDSFSEVAEENISFAMGEPEGVPVGQYTKEIFEYLGTWKKIEEKAVLGSDVRQVLSWVESGEVDCGVVYGSDIVISENVKILCEADENSHKKVIYPGAVISESQNKDISSDFMEFIKNEKSAEIFKKYGFSTIE